MTHLVIEKVMDDANLLMQEELILLSVMVREKEKHSLDKIMERMEEACNADQIERGYSHQALKNMNEKGGVLV